MYGITVDKVGALVESNFLGHDLRINGPLLLISFVHHERVCGGCCELYQVIRVG